MRYNFWNLFIKLFWWRAAYSKKRYDVLKTLSNHICEKIRELNDLEDPYLTRDFLWDPKLARIQKSRMLEPDYTVFQSLTDPKLGIFGVKSTFHISQSRLVIHHSFNRSNVHTTWCCQSRLVHCVAVFLKISLLGFIWKFPDVFRFIKLHKNIWATLFHCRVFSACSIITSGAIWIAYRKAWISFRLLRKESNYANHNQQDYPTDSDKTWY